MAEIVANTSAALHELHLLFVNAEYAAIAVRFSVETDHEAVAQRCHLIVVADACHRATLRNEVAEMVEKSEYLLMTHRIWVFCLDTGYLCGDAVVHVGRSLLIDVAEGVL